MSWKHMLESINIFKVHAIRKSIQSDVKEIKDCHLTRKHKVEEYQKALREERESRHKEQQLFLSVLDHLDDMVWAKALDGKYIMANKAFREKFCYGMTWDELQGKTDQEIAAVFKAKVGDKNHTFGEVCANSDEIIKRTQKAREFLEYGNIDGKLVKLVVNKSPVYTDGGVMYATCGTGRDITWLHDSLEVALRSCKNCPGNKKGYELLCDLFSSIEFKEGDHAK